MNIVIRENTQWSSSPRSLAPPIRDVYIQYKEREHYYRETPYCDGVYIVYRPDNDPYMPTYIARIADVTRTVMTDDLPVLHNGTIAISREIHAALENAQLTTPILDLNDIRVFMTYTAYYDGDIHANWVPAHSYQIWAYRDFMYDPLRSIRKSYMSRGTHPSAYESDPRILANQIVTIEVGGIAPNIVFNLIRNENGSVCLERNDATTTRMRICDNEYARRGYLGFYTRTTMDPGIIIEAARSASVGDSNSTLLSTTHLSELKETDVPEAQCILCLHYSVNARFSPCEHQVCCSSCYSQLSKNECPVCRAKITRLLNV